jgi:nitrogen fixation/metabolism regulation signal transduction histidine kinase
MKLSSDKTKAGLLLLPFVFLFLWFRFEEFFHSHLLAVLLWLVLSYGMLFLLYKGLQGKGRIAIVTLWIVISSLVFVDFWQLLSYRDYSEQSFQQKVDESTVALKKRAEIILRQTENDSRDVEQALRKIDPLTIDNMFSRLPAQLQTFDFYWGIYGQDGQMICWSGQLPYRERYTGNGGEDVSVYSELHQQFLKVKRPVRIGASQFTISVLRPISADYGIENRYLHTYNLLTDGLSLRPDLLYNSQQSTTTSPDLVIRSVAVAPDFSISTLYKKGQYDEFLIHRVFQLHWWLELAALGFILFTAVFLFFEFVGISARQKGPGLLILWWFLLLAVSIASVTTISHFSAFGSSGLFRVNDVSMNGWEMLFHSPGCFVLTSFFVVNVVLGLAFLLRGLGRQIPWKGSLFNYTLLFGAFIGSGLLFLAYYNFVRHTLLFSPFDPVDSSLLQIDPVKISEVFGMLWLDLAFVLLIALLYHMVMKNLPRNLKGILNFVALQILGLLVFYGGFASGLSMPFLPSIFLYFGIGLLVLFLPALWNWLGRINLLSRFLATLVIVSLISFLFHFTRFHYAADMQKSFIEQEAASQVKGQDETLRSLINASQRELDEAVENLSLDPKIPDLAYRLWTRTELARLGFKSAVEIYDEKGTLLNRFALNLPKLSLDVSRNVPEQGWDIRQRFASFGNFRKAVLLASRDLPDIGFLVLEAVEDYENIPFVPASSPFQELFRPKIDPRLYVGSPSLNVYDPAWHPVFVSNPELSPPVPAARKALENSTSSWSSLQWNGQGFLIYYFRISNGFAALITPVVSLRTHLVHLIDLFMFNLLWLSLFALIALLFFKKTILLHVRTDTGTRFNFFQKLLFAFLVFSMIPMLFLSLFIRNYVQDKKVDEVTSRALHSFSVASKVVSDYVFYRAENQESVRGQLFSNELLEWISQVIQQDVSLYYDRYLQAASDRELYSAGLLGEQIPGDTYVDLFYKGQKFSISEMKIGSLHFLNVSGRMYSGRFKDEVITIPFLIDQKSVEAEIIGLREYMMLVGAGLILFAVLLGYFLASRFSRPVHVLIRGTGEMSRGNLQYRIRESYGDEFQRLVDSFNAMAESLHENQEALERRRAYIENILNNITTGVISADSTINVTTINPGAARMFGLDPTYRGALDSKDIFRGEWTRVHQTIETFLKRKEEFQIREVAMFGTNTETHLRLVWVPLFDDEGWNGGILLVEDISDIIRSNRLSAYAEMARQVAHEVKNPLTPIQLAMEHLMKVYEDRSESFDSVLRSCSDAVLKQVKALRRLVSDFSQYGRPAVLNRTDVNLRDFLQDVVASYKGHLPEGITMDSNLDSHLPVTRIDAEKLRGALMNIIENGLQAMNGNGKITVEATNGANCVTIRIRDTGAGIPPDVLPRLFEPYFSTKTGGTGLGLAIARKNVEDQGGKIQIESELQRGTTITIHLPAN